MKTLNKTLSLVLALVMVFSLFGVASAAELKDFTDKGDVTYTEAIDYLTAANIVAGDTATTINPKGNFTREQAAKLVAYAMLGQAAADAMTAPAAPFSDVAADRWSAGYIAYCVNAGVINGMGDGSFAPTAEVTGYQMAKMLLCALGYGVNGEFTGASWQLEVAKLSLAKDIFYGNTAGANNTTGATREEAFLYTFNTLTRAMMVKYNDSLKVYYSGTNPFEENQTFQTKNTIGFQRFKMEKTADDGTYSEKAHYWAIDGKSVTDTYPDDAVTVLATSAVGTPYANLTSKSDPKYIGYSADDTLTYYINGDKQADSTAVVAAAALRGNVVNFYDTDKNGKYDTVDVLVYKVVKLTAAPVINKSGSTDVVTIADMGLKNIVASNVKGEYKDLKKDDYVLFYSNAKGTTWHVAKCESVTGQLFGFNDSVYQVNVNGATANVSQIAMNGSATPTAAFATAWNSIIETKGLAGTVFYYDMGKNICGAEPTENVVAAANVVFTTDVDNATVGTSVMAEMLKSDGTTVIKTINKYIGTNNSSVAATTSNVVPNTFYTFTENTDGTYNLKAIATAQGTPKVAHQLTAGVYSTAGKAVFKKGNASFFYKEDATSVATLGTSKTVFVIEGEGTRAGTYTAYTGVSAIPNVNADSTPANTTAYVLNDKDGYAIMAVALGGDLDTTAANYEYAFIGADASHVAMTSNATEDYYQYDYAVINGEIKKFKSTNDLNLVPGVYAVDGYDGDKVNHVVSSSDPGYSTSRLATTSNGLAATGKMATGFDVVGNTVTVQGDAATSFVVTNDVKVFVLDGYDKASGVVTIDKYDSISVIENLRGDLYTVLTLKVAEKDATINVIFVGIQPKGTVTGPVDETNMYYCDWSDVDQVSFVYYNWDTAPSASYAASLIANKLKTAEGYTTVSISNAAGVYTIVGDKTVNGIKNTDTYTFDSTGTDFAEIFTVSLAALTNSSATDFAKLSLDGMTAGTGILSLDGKLYAKAVGGAVTVKVDNEAMATNTTITASFTGATDNSSTPTTLANNATAGSTNQVVKFNTVTGNVTVKLTVTNTP